MDFFFFSLSQCYGLALQLEKSIICPSLILQIEKSWLKIWPKITPLNLYHEQCLPESGPALENRQKRAKNLPDSEKTPARELENNSRHGC